jgi:hypothetical protein
MEIAPIHPRERGSVARKWWRAPAYIPEAGTATYKACGAGAFMAAAS